MQIRGSSHRLSSMGNNRSRIPALLISMFATFASIYVAGRLWQDAENRVYLIKELDRITGQGQSAISVDDTLKIIACREQHKKLDAIETELAGARQEGFVSKPLIKTNGTYSMRRPLVVIGILTKFGRQKNRDAIRKAWMGSGASLKKIEEGKGIIVQFVIGRSENRGDNQDKDIDRENRLTNDFIILVFGIHFSMKILLSCLILNLEMEPPEYNFLDRFNNAPENSAHAKIESTKLIKVRIGGNFTTENSVASNLSPQPIVLVKLDQDNHVETNDAFPKKAKLFFAHAADKWDAEFYAKVNDDVYVNIDALGATLATHLDKPRVYMGCMKSGEVFSELNHKWYEPEWWKFGDKKSYFRHASGEMYVISQALAKFISINRSILRTYAHDDVSAGSWFIGLDVKHVDEAKFCCSSWSTGAICAGV
ncbi:hypothetical protein JHK86_011177 [Glycine max]|nr:hypothetical protein JHK86_011177 [Glycine max]